MQNHFENNPRTSIRKAGAVLNTTYYAVQKCLREVGLKPYRFTAVHGLQPGDTGRRLDACLILGEMLEMEADLHTRLVFSDEAGFHVSGFVNSSTCRIWGYENPHARYEFFRDDPKINVWCGLTSQHAIGPFFFIENTVTHANYLDMLQNFAVPIMEDLGITARGYFMQDGAPPHWAWAVRDYLDEVFPRRWIGRNGPLLWPARSPDLNPCDFFLWGSIKNNVYNGIPIQNVHDLRVRITAAFDYLRMGNNLLANVIEEFKNRLHTCIANDGAHVE